MNGPAEPLAASPLFRLARLFALVAGLVMIASAALVSLDVLYRGLFGRSPLRSFELTSYAFAAATAFSLGYALLEGRHVRIDAVYRLFPEPVRTVFDIANLALMVGVSCMLAYHGIFAARESYLIGANSVSSLQMPLVVPQGIWAAGLIWFAFCALALALRTARNLGARRFKQVRAESGIDTEQTESGVL